ncbi:MAG: ECF transporter S component [Candidatus Caldatribacterium sp.]|nr:ECF transporter S component [Candidatus Caldatribacterium sp.]
MVRKGIRTVTLTGVLFALILIVQALGLPYVVAGPLVNAMLLLATVFVGVGGGVLIGLLTPWVALLRGILPAPLGPIVPFIMLGNAVFVTVFGLFRRKGEFFFAIGGVVLGAFAKYLVLSQAVRLLIDLPPPVARMMQVPQLITALLGETIALFLSQALQRVHVGE